MVLSEGERLGRFVIRGPVGAGGMGEVYRAWDERLAREVAIKVLPGEFADDPGRRRRLEREARAVARLSHPNILAIHDFGYDDGVLYAVTELLDGETVRDRLGRRRMEWRAAVRIAADVATGLGAAHRQGVVHRDLKPENIFITSDDRVKILDFGLARVVDPDADDSGRPEVADTLTQDGAIVGTLGYVSPEQLASGEADARSDIFALGCVLYEMLSGRRAFRRDSAPETMAATLSEDPPPIEAESLGLPGELTSLVDRCLEKRPDGRFESANDLAFALRQVLERVAETSPPIRGRTKSTALRWLAVIAAVVLGFVAAYVIAPVGNDGASPTFERITYRRGPIFQARFAPGDSSVFYSASWDGEPVEIYQTTLGFADARSLDLAPASLLSVSGKGQLAVALSPVFQLTFYAPGQLALLPATGGAPPRELADDIATADWDPETGDLVVARALDDGSSDLEWPLGHPVYRARGLLDSVRVSPDGRRVAFFEHRDDAATLVVVDRSGQSWTDETRWKKWSGGVAWSPDGAEVWFTATTDWSPARLWAVRPGGSVRLVLALPGGIRLQDIATDGRVLLSLWNYRISMNGGELGSPTVRDLSWFGWSFVSDVSADGASVLFSDLRSEGPDRHNSWFVRPMTGGPAVELTSAPSEDAAFFGAKFSPDGRAAAVPSNDRCAIRIEPVGAGEARTIPLSSGVQFWGSLAWLPSDRGLVFLGVRDTGNERALFELPFDGSPLRPLRQATELQVVLSPDGSRTAGRLDDHRLRLVGLDGEAPREVLCDEALGNLLRWSSDGSAIFFYRQGEVPAGIYRIDLGNGHVTLVRRLMPPDPAGVWRIHPVALSADGLHYAFSVSRWMSDLYVFDGLD